MADEETVQKHGLDLRLVGAALALSLLCLGAAWYLNRKLPPCAPCKEHTDGEAPLIEVAKASAEQAANTVADWLPIPQEEDD